MPDGGARDADNCVKSGFAAIVAALGSRTEASVRPKGWKIGLNASSMQRQLGLSAPVLGVLTGETLCEGAQLLAARPGILVIEAELAVRIGAASPDGRSAVDAVAPAFELLCIDGPLDDLETLVRRNSYHAAYALGDWVPCEVLNVAGVPELALTIGDGEAMPAEPDLIVGSPEDVVRFAQRFLAQFGLALAKGDTIICGALNAPAQVRNGAAVSADFRDVGSITRTIAQAQDTGPREPAPV